MDRIEQVARLIRNRRLGPTEAEIVAATERGLVTGAQANWLLERMAEVEDWAAHEREVPCGAYLEEEVDGESVEDAAARAEASNLLLRVINDLTGRQRQCVELHFYGDMKQAQIAERLGISQQMVSQHIAAALRNLAEISAGDLVKSPPDRRYRVERTFWEALMRDSIRETPRSKPWTLPYLLWAKWGVGVEQCANGVWISLFENRLPEYLKDRFGDRGVVAPWKY